MMGKTSVLGMCMLGLSALPVTSVAQEYSYENAYIHYVDGDVTLQRATEPEPEPGAINVPILPGDRLWTHANSRVAIRFADGTILRLDESTKVDFVAFDGEPNILLWSGSAILKLGASSAKPRIDSQAGSVYPQFEGVYRIDVRDGTTMTLSVGQGRAELASTEGSVLVGAGEQSYIEASQEPQSPSTPLAFDAASGDAFDQWSAQRDLYDPRRREVPLAEVPEEVHHYVDELSEHGEWRAHEEQGYAWYPSVSVGWAPYRHGHWGYTHYGYTWISYEPWGWAPYHYGRWGYNHHGWHWVPGHHWGPAWVSFAIGPAWVGWSPLGYYGGPVFSYTSFHHGFNNHGRTRGARYRGGKAVPRHVYDNGAGWNFSHTRNFGSRARHARLRVDQVRSTSSAAELHTTASVLDRNLTPHALDARGRAQGTLRPPRGVILRAARTPSARPRAASPEVSLQRAQELIGRTDTKVIRRNNATERAAARRLSTGRSGTTARRGPSSTILRATTRSGSQERTDSQTTTRTFRTPNTTGSRPANPSGNRTEGATPTRTPRTPAATTARPTTRSRSRTERVTTPRTFRTPTTTGSRPANPSGNRTERATPTHTPRTPAATTARPTTRSRSRTERVTTPRTFRTPTTTGSRPANRSRNRTERAMPTRTFRTPSSGSATRPNRSGTATRSNRSGTATRSNRSGTTTRSNRSGTTTRSNRSGFRTQGVSPGSRRRAPAAQPRPRSSTPRGTTRGARGTTRSRPSGMRSTPRPSRGGSATRSRGSRGSQGRGSARSRGNNNR